MGPEGEKSYPLSLPPGQQDQERVCKVDLTRSWKIRLTVAGHSVDLFALRVGVLLLKVSSCNTFLAVRVPWCSVYPVGTGLRFPVAVLCNAGT